MDAADTAFSGRVGWGRVPAVIVVDAVRAYSDPSSPLYLEAAAGAIAAMTALRDSAVRGGRHVIYTAVSFPRGKEDAPLFFAKVPALRVFSNESRYTLWPDQLTPGAGDWVVRKHYASAFFGTDLAGSLTLRGVDTVVVCGFSTSGCVRATALDALQNGFRPIVVREACADRSVRAHDSNLFDLDAKYADVVSLAEALRELEPEGSCEVLPPIHGQEA